MRSDVCMLCEDFRGVLGGLSAIDAFHRAQRRDEPPMNIAALRAHRVMRERCERGRAGVARTFLARSAGDALLGRIMNSERTTSLLDFYCLLACTRLGDLCKDFFFFILCGGV